MEDGHFNELKKLLLWECGWPQIPPPKDRSAKSVNTGYFLLLTLRKGQLSG